MDNPEQQLVRVVGQRYVHPDNMTLERINENAIALPKPVIKRIRNEQKRLETLLRKNGYFDIKQRHAHARDEFNELMKQRVICRERNEQPPAQLIAELRLCIQVARQTQSLMRQQHSNLVAYKRATLRIKQHEAGVDRQRAVAHAEAILRADSIELASIITANLTQLGYCHHYTVEGRKYTDSVKIQLIRNTPDVHYFKLHAFEKGWFGWLPKLPYGVNPVDLMQEKVTKALESALQLRVEAVPTVNNGYWYKVFRLQTADGIIDRLNYADVLPSTARYNHQHIPIVMGVGEGRQETVISLAHYPHMLIAGMSGSGKSNMVKNIISTIITNHAPSEVRLVLVDMKEGLEFKTYEDNEVPHLINNVVKSPAELATVLAGLETMRIERSRQMSRVYAVNINEYNERVPDKLKMPRVVVVIDEFGAIYMNDPHSDERENKRIANQCKAFVRQLLAKARSAGIHIIICTQTPYAEILPGPDKANIAIKVAGRLPTQASSRVVLDNVDAATLPDDPPGRMIISVNGMQWQLQTPGVTELDVNNAIEVARGYDQNVELNIVPEPMVKLSFTPDDMVELALTNYDGAVLGTKMWRDGIKDMGLLTFRECLDMANTITMNETYTHRGTMYDVVRVKGGGKRLVLRTAHIEVAHIGVLSADNGAETDADNEILAD